MPVCRRSPCKRLPSSRSRKCICKAWISRSAWCRRGSLDNEDYVIVTQSSMIDDNTNRENLNLMDYSAASEAVLKFLLRRAERLEQVALTSSSSSPHPCMSSLHDPRPLPKPSARSRCTQVQ